MANENWVTEALSLGEVVVIEDSNIQMNVDVKQAITDDTFLTEKNCILELGKNVLSTSQFFYNYS